MPKEKKRAGLVKEMLKSIFLHNGWIKLLSLVLSMLLWAGLVSRDKTLTREKVFNDVSVGITGEDTIKRNGYIVVDGLEDQIENVSITVNVPQLQYESATAANYNTRIDLSRVNSVGLQDLRIQSSGSSTWGTVTSVVPDHVTVEVEEYVTRYRIPVSVSMTDSMPEGWWISTPSVDPPMIAVSGPRSIVEGIARATVNLSASDIPKQEGNVILAEPFSLYDRQGNMVESDLIQVTSESVLLDSMIVETNVYPVKALSVSDLGVIQGKPADGYEIKRVMMEPDTVLCASRGDQLEVLNTIFADHQIIVDGLSGSIESRVKLRKPSEIVYCSTDSVTVIVEIEPVITSKTFTGVKISTINEPEGSQSILISRSANVTLTGEAPFLNSLKPTDISLVADLKGLSAGMVVELPLNCLISAETDTVWKAQCNPDKIQVRIK